MNETSVNQKINGGFVFCMLFNNKSCFLLNRGKALGDSV